MSLREQAAADLVGIVEDASGFGWPVKVTAPTGASLEMTGLSTDIGLTVDPQTGVAVSGRKASVALAIRTLSAAGFDLPRAVAETSSRPWVIEFKDIAGRAHVYRVTETMPDRAIGCITCIVESHVRSA